MRKLAALLPTPRRYHAREGSFRLRHDLPIVLGAGSTAGDFRSALALRSRIEAHTGLTLPVETHARIGDLGPRIELTRTGEKGDGYRLEVTRDTMRVSGEGASGLRYGIETLSQLLGRSRDVRCCTIDDAPDLDKRGLLIDISRGKVPTLQTLKGIVDEMVRLKLNLLMLYTEHVFHFRRHPEIGRNASPMEAWEIRELDAYAAERHVELVPTLQSLGHMHQILNLPGFRHLAESEKRWSLSPAREQSYELLSDLYAEYLPNFSSSWFNANCDEPVDLGRGLSKEWAEREGRAAVFASHVRRVKALAAEHGKRTLIWADVVHEHPGVLDQLPDGLILLDWWYEADHDFDRVQVFADRKIPFLVAAGTSSWNTLFPRLANAVSNIRGYAEAAKRHRGVGLLTTDWGDGGHPNLLGNSAHGFAWGAQCAWGRSDLADEEFDRAFAWSSFSDRSGATGRLYRRLGALHETGFDHFNHSPLKSLYFDDWTDATYTRKSRRSILVKTLRRLQSVERALVRSEVKLQTRPSIAAELRFAVEVSRAAAEKGLLGLEYLDFENDASSWTPSRRKRLARSMERMAQEQAKARERHRELWLARNRLSGFETTRGYYERSLRGLRRAVRKLGH
ncbi:MAG TPA: beta-N-acetylhexosaminidase [Vicinamibacteria bacterium]|nr:beta-N-acetylhexosaminidase [Vicinamibacteria bacterium]